MTGFASTNAADLVLHGAASLDEVVVERLHQTHTIVDFDTFIEDIRYIFRNPSDQSFTLLPLAWRQREVQANMIVLDNEGKNLVYLHSKWISQIEKRFLQTLWNRFAADLSTQEQTVLSQDLSVIEQIAAFDIPLDVREKVKGVLGKLETQYPDSTEFQKVVRFVRLCAGYYLPFVELTRPVLEGESILVRHGVDVYQHDTDLSLWERMRFVFLGKIRFEFGIPFYAFETPPFSTTMSYHLRIRTPSGLRITDRPIPLTERMFKEVKLEGFLNYESDNVYVYFDRNAVNQLIRNRETIDKSYETRKSKIRSQLQRLPSTTTEQKFVGKVAAAVVNALGSSIIHRLEMERLEEREATIAVDFRLTEGMGYLLALLWATVGLTYAYSIFGLLSPENYGLWFSGFLVVVLTIVVFSLDKRIIRDLVAAHGFSAAAVVLALPALQYLTKTIGLFAWTLL